MHHADVHPRRPPGAAPRCPRPRRPAPDGWAAGLLVLAAALPAWAQTAACEPLRERIERQIRDKGVPDARVAVVDRADDPAGRVVGTCDSGRRVLVYRRDPTPSPTPTPTPPAAADPLPAARSVDRAPPAPATGARPAPVITECADGSTPADGRCPPRR